MPDAVSTRTTYEFLTLESDGAVARLTLRRPPLNVLHLPMIDELNRALEPLAGASSLRALVLAAEGKAFSAGVSVEDHLPDRVRPMITAFHGVFRRLRALPCPVIAAVQGAALGGGCELACFADIVIASESAVLGQPEIKLGVFPPVAAVRFPERIGVARTVQLLLSGEVLPAREAERIGLVDRVVAPGDLAGAVAEAAARLRDKSAAALRLARQAAYATSRAAFEAALAEVERLFLDDLMSTADAALGLRAFLEKRPPVWSHR